MRRHNEARSILDILRASGGMAVAVSDEDIFSSLKDWAANEGIFLSPEGAAAAATYAQLLQSGALKASDRVVLFNTGAGLKYTDVIASALGLTTPGQNRSIGCPARFTVPSLHRIRPSDGIHADAFDV